MALFGNNGSSLGSNTANASGALGDISKDVAVEQPPEDGISDLSFSPKSNYLAVASWDKKTRIYEITDEGKSIGRAAIDSEAPVLACCWYSDGTKVVSAGADKHARLLDIASSSTTPVALHDAPIKSARFVDIPNAAGPVLVTGGWDKKIKYWDLRSSNAICTIECQERVYSIDTIKSMLVVATADRYINVVNLSDPTKWYKTMHSPLKWQTRVVTCFSDGTGFAVGSIEGRCAMQYVEEKDSQGNFSFKCHRQPVNGARDMTNVYAVNAINFHPVHGTFSTAGSDGTYHFWDKDAKHRLKGYPEVGGPISATAFNAGGTIFAYSVSYDWSKGFGGNVQGAQNKVMLHPIQPDECKPRPKARK